MISKKKHCDVARRAVLYRPHSSKLCKKYESKLQIKVVEIYNCSKCSNLVYRMFNDRGLVVGTYISRLLPFNHYFISKAIQG